MSFLTTKRPPLKSSYHPSQDKTHSYFIQVHRRRGLWVPAASSANGSQKFYMCLLKRAGECHKNPSWGKKLVTVLASILKKNISAFQNRLNLRSYLTLDFESYPSTPRHSTQEKGQPQGQKQQNLRLHRPGYAMLFHFSSYFFDSGKSSMDI